MRNVILAGCLIVTLVRLGSSAVTSAAENKPVKPKFVVFATRQDADLRSSLFRILRGNDEVARFDKANTIAEAVESEADVLVLVMPKRTSPELGETILEELKKRKIIGIGYGAAQLFGRLGLEIKGGACAHFRGTPPIITVVKSELLGAPKNSEPLKVLRDETEAGRNVDIFAMFLPPHGPNPSVDALARWNRDANYAPIVRQGNFVLVGIPIPATEWAPSYADLVRDTSIALHAREPEVFTAAHRALTKPGTYEFKLAKSRSTDQPFGKTFYFRFQEATRFSAELEHAGSDSVMMLFMGEDEGRTHWTRRDARREETLKITTEIRQANIAKLGDRYWRLEVTNFGADKAECKLTITIEKSR